MSEVWGNSMVGVPVLVTKYFKRVLPLGQCRRTKKDFSKFNCKREKKDKNACIKNRIH